MKTKLVLSFIVVLLLSSLTVFGIVAFVPGGGWVVSGLYFLGKAAHASTEELIQTKYGGDREAWRRDVVGYGMKCFIAGTKITMADGTLKNIEDVVEGDVVKTYNLEKGKLENHPVLLVENPVHSDLVEISFEKNIMNTNTFDHPYFVKEKGWCSYKPEQTKLKYGLQAQQLEVGDVCYLFNGKTIEEVEVLQIKENMRPETTYNLSDVAVNNNFFANGILVHNKMITPVSFEEKEEGEKSEIDIDGKR